MYSLFLHNFQIVLTITQELCSVQIIVLSEFDKRIFKKKVDFLMNALKFEILIHYKHFTSTTTRQII